MNCNLTDEERKTKKARCRSWDCSACNNFYSNCLNEEINKLEKEIAELKAQLEIAKEALKEIEDKCYGDDSRAWSFASDALEKLETTGE